MSITLQMSVRFSVEAVLRDEPLIRRPQSCGLLVSKLREVIY